MENKKHNSLILLFLLYLYFNDREQYVIPSIPESNENNEEHQPNSLEKNLEPTLEHDKTASTSHHEILESPLSMKESPLNEMTNNVNEVKVDQSLLLIITVFITIFFLLYYFRLQK